MQSGAVLRGGTSYAIVFATLIFLRAKREGDLQAYACGCNKGLLRRLGFIELAFCRLLAQKEREKMREEVQMDNFNEGALGVDVQHVRRALRLQRTPRDLCNSHSRMASPPMVWSQRHSDRFCPPLVEGGGAGRPLSRFCCCLCFAFVFHCLHRRFCADLDEAGFLVNASQSGAVGAEQ